MHSELPQLQDKTESEIRSWLVSRLEKELDLPVGTINIKKPVSRYGLDSLLAVAISADLEDWLGCEISPNALIEHPTVEALALHLSSLKCGASPALAAEFESPPASWSLVQRIIRAVISLLASVLCRVDARGAFPASGPYLLAMNHLHVFDTPILFALLPAPAAFFVSVHMKRFRMANWFLSKVANTIWVSRGEGDVSALESAVAVLRSGGIVAIAPEGKISRNGGLLKGHTGAAYLSTQAAVPILPMVAYGQEKAFKYWLRFRRVPVEVRIGSLMHLPAGKTAAKQLEICTDALMIELARMLPAEYRGIYG